MVPELWLTLIFSAVAFVVLIESGKRIVRAVGVLARAMRISEFVLSFVLIAFASAMPELSVGLNAAFSGVPELSFGDIVGTNIINITLVLGTIAAFGGAITVRDYAHFSNNRLFQLTIVLAPLILILDGTLSRLDGGILLILLAWHLIRLLDIDDQVLGRKVLRPHLVPYVNEQPVSRAAVLKQSVYLVLSLVALLTATFIIVYSAKLWAEALSVPTVIVGVLVVAMATSLPELIIGYRSARSGHGGVALGDIFGASAINATLTLGLVALIHPIELYDHSIVYGGISFTILSFALVFWFLHTKRSLAPWEGRWLLVCYVLFVIVQILLV